MGKVFHHLNFHLALSSSLCPLDNMNLLHLYVEEQYFSGLIFVVEVDEQKFFHNENILVHMKSQDKCKV